MRAFLGLGANLQQPAQQILSAIAVLDAHPQIKVVQRSRLYCSRPMGPQDQPDYVNAVVEITTDLFPLALLDACQAIEQQHHRERNQHWGARTLDIDILAIDALTIDSQRLKVPHPGIAQRDFVVLPWQEIASHYVIPCLGEVGCISVADGFNAQPCEIPQEVAIE